MKSKLLARHELCVIAEEMKRSGKTIVFTNGCFDLLHLGHARYLREAKSHGDILIVGVNSDDSVRRLKGKGRPLVPELDRAELVSSLEMVDYVTLFDEDTPAELIAELRPDVLVKGADYAPDEVSGRETVETYGGKVILVPLLENRSTTSLVERIRKSRSGAGFSSRGD